MARCDESFSSLGGALDGFRWLVVMNFSLRWEVRWMDSDGSV